MNGLIRVKDYAILTNDGKYTIFEFNGQRIRFVTSDKLEKYTKIIEWDKGYLVVMAKYKEFPEVEEYIDLIPILEMLYYDVDDFLKPIKEVKIDDAANFKRCWKVHCSAVNHSADRKRNAK